jgi:ornithine cyclodeaminase/alanine dehydrogenase-like protein (mu-crystallin family)
MARGAIENKPRTRTRIGDGVFAVMSAADEELELAGLKAYTWLPGGTPFVVVLFDAAKAELAAVIEADKLGQLRTGAASGVAAKYLARPEAKTLGVIGCGWQAESQVACIREAVPTIERVVAYCRNEQNLQAFCKKVGAEAAETHREPAEQDVVVTVTTSKDPVLRGEWLEPGALVCAVGANEPKARELDNAVLERAVFVCCDSVEQARLESGDLIEPVERGVLDWLEVHELHEVVAGELPGRSAPDDIVLFKSNGLAAWDVAIGAKAIELARKKKVGKRV